MSAAWSLGQIHAVPEVSVPALIQFLRDSDSDTRRNAAKALWCFGAAAKQAVPALVESLQDPSVAVQSEAANALKKIDPEAAAKALINEW
jgi:HEAT repeat protein